MKSKGIPREKKGDCKFTERIHICLAPVHIRGVGDLVKGKKGKKDVPLTYERQKHNNNNWGAFTKEEKIGNFKCFCHQSIA